jgi:hypothetical protein
MNPVYVLALTFFKMQFSITFQSTLMFPMWSLAIRLSNQNFVCISHISSSYHLPHLSCSPLFYYPNNNNWKIVQIVKILMNFSPVFWLVWDMLGKIPIIICSMWIILWCSMCHHPLIFLPDWMILWQNLLYLSIINNNDVHSSIRNIGCLQIFSILLGSWQ